MEVRHHARRWILFAWLGALYAANLGPDLLSAAKKGQADRVAALLTQGADLESKDKDGRTPLMLAAEHGHAEVVRVLLEKGANADARDKQGWTAYALAIESSAGGRADVLKALPPHKPIRLVVHAVLAPDNLYSSCFLNPKQLAQQVQEASPDGLVLTAFREAAAGADKGAVELVAADGDAVLTLRVRPRVACVQQDGSDHVRMAIDANLVRSGESKAIFEKTYGGGLKSVRERERIVNSPAQYRALFEEWAKTDGGSIYSSVITALLKSL